MAEVALLGEGFIKPLEHVRVGWHVRAMPRDKVRVHKPGCWASDSNDFNISIGALLVERYEEHKFIKPTQPMGYRS